MSKVDLNGRAGAVFSLGEKTMELNDELKASGDYWVLYASSVGLWSDGSEAFSGHVGEASYANTGRGIEAAVNAEPTMQ